MPRGRPPLPPDQRRPRRSGPSGTALPESDPARALEVSARLHALRVEVTARRRDLGLAAAALGDACTWQQLAAAAARRVPGDLPVWASGRRRVSEATLRSLERVVMAWCAGEVDPSVSGDDDLS